MLVIAFAAGLTIFRQTRAIWRMNSSNACTINTTLNTYTAIEPLLIVIIFACIPLAYAYIKKGFG